MALIIISDIIHVIGNSISKNAVTLANIALDIYSEIAKLNKAAKTEEVIQNSDTKPEPKHGDSPLPILLNPPVIPHEYRPQLGFCRSPAG